MVQTEIHSKKIVTITHANSYIATHLIMDKKNAYLHNFSQKRANHILIQI